MPRRAARLVFGARCQRNLRAGQEHGRTIPLTELNSLRQYNAGDDWWALAKSLRP
jgi:hypothetical protein